MDLSDTSFTLTESNVRQAINACREERGSIIRNREEMQTIRESLDDGYCDISGRVGDLALIGSLSLFLYQHIVICKLFRYYVGCEVFRVER